MHTLSYNCELPAIATFGRRKVAPRVCIADSKEHIRNFLRDALEELGFIASDCAPDDDVRRLIAERLPDLFVLGLSAGGVAASLVIEALADSVFDGKVLVFGQPSAPMVTAILGLGKELGLSMLPLLPTPFRDSDLRDRVAALLPVEAPPSPPVNVAEALHAGWLELWYQPKIDIRSLTLCGAEALVRMRHPTWGIVPPACFIPDADDPHFGALSDFVVTRAATDWRYFVGEYGPIVPSINLPLNFFREPGAAETLSGRLPKHPAFEGLIVEINAPELVQNLPLATAAARTLQLHNIGMSIDNLGAEWPMLLTLEQFPFVEIKVDRAFAAGCADDRLKQSTCRRIIELADSFGARTVAEGVETRADFVTARELGFDTIQGFFFGKPMEPQKFARRVLSKPVSVAE